ncbi:MAG TPA: PAS domain S-box protein, partial [Cytophagaceae bacterium]
MELQNSTAQDLLSEIDHLKKKVQLLESKKSENQYLLNQTDLQFRKVFERVRLLTLSIDNTGKISYINDALLKFTGWNSEDILGKTWSEVFERENDSEHEEDKLAKIFEGNTEVLKLKKKLIAKNGTLRTIKFQVITERNQSDEIVYVTLLGEDITEKKRVIRALKESNEDLQDLFENANDLIQVFTIEGKMIFVNNAWKNTLGYSNEEIESLNLHNIIHEDYKEETLAFLDKVWAGDKSDKIETAFQTKTGKTIQVIGSINVRYENGKPVTFRGIFHDNTERIRAERAQNLYYKIANLAINSDNLETLLYNIHQELKTLIAVNNFHVALYDKDKNYLNFPYYVDETLGNNIITLKRIAGKGLTEYSLFSEKPVILYEEDIMLLAQEGIVELMGPVPKIWLGVPLRLENRTIGVIAVKSHSDRNKYKLRHLELLDFISGQIAIAIERKRNEDQIIAQRA